MTTPNNTVAGLAEKWREDMDRNIPFHSLTDDRRTNFNAGVAHCMRDLKRAALASPAPSAGVVDDAMLERGLKAAREASDARLPRYSVVRAILEAALSGVSAPVEDGQRDRLTNMLNVFADQQGWITLADGRTYGALQCLLHVFNGKDLQQPAWNAPPAAAPRVEDDPNGQHCQECRFTMSGLGYCVNCATPTPSEDNATPAAEQPEAPPSVAGDAGELPEVEGLTPKQAWWAGARAALGLPADTPRIEVARRLATAEQPGSAVQGEAERKFFARDFYEDAKAGKVPWPEAKPAPAAEQGEAVELTKCCGREECGGECGNEWRGTEWVRKATQPEARGVARPWWTPGASVNVTVNAAGVPEIAAQGWHFDGKGLTPTHTDFITAVFAWIVENAADGRRVYDTPKPVRVDYASNSEADNDSR